MVPLRVIAESLAANVEWADPEVKITKLGQEVVLKASSKSAVINGKTVQMDVAPYIKNKRIYVPIRFISEIFGYGVDYANKTVSIETLPLFIEGKQVYAMQNESYMTMGSIVSQVTANAYVEAFYDLFQQSKGDLVKPPLIQNWITGSVDPGSYSKGGTYQFLDKDGKILVQLELYSLNRDFPAELLAPYSPMLLYDVTSGQWFLYESKDAFNQLSDMAIEQGYWLTISNTAV